MRQHVYTAGGTAKLAARLMTLATALYMVAACANNTKKHWQIDNLDKDTTAVADTTDLQEVEIPRGADELFDDFIFNYASNSKLQKERTNFPLAVVRGGKTDSISRRQWRHDPLFVRQDSYTLIFDTPEQQELTRDTALNQATVEKILLDNDSVVEYNFVRLHGQWRLSDIKGESMLRNDNAAFLQFYRKFTTDSLFQVNSLNTQIGFSGPDPDDDFAQMEGFITPDMWTAFAPELPTGTIYNIVYGKINPHSGNKILVMRGIANGLEIELTFTLKNGNWKLTRMAM